MSTDAQTSAYETSAYESASRKILANDPESAVRELSAALHVSPNSGRLWELQGLAEMACGNEERCVAALEEATCLTPLSIEARFTLARGYEQIGKRSLAGDLYAGLSERDQLPQAMLEPLACALGRMSKPEAALKVCADAANRMPDCVAPLLAMVFYKRRLGHPPKQLLPLLFRAFHLNPDDFDNRLALARMLQELGQSREASELLSPVPIEALKCPRCLAAMQSIFAEVGDQENVSRCVDALISLATE